MEFVDAKALKSSFLKEIAMKSSSTQQVFLDDLWCVTGINTVSCDDFSVDDLLDFSNEDFKDGSCYEEEEKDSLSVSSSQELKDDSNSNAATLSVSDDVVSLPDGELSFPIEDLENLEWLSQFVDDSSPELSLLCPTGDFKAKTGKFFQNRVEPAAQKFALPLFPTRFPAKARSKRSRPASGRIWPVGSASLTDSSSTSSSSSHGSSSTSDLIPNPVQSVDSFSTFLKPPAKKQKRKSVPENGSSSSGAQTQRRCSHCHVQKTPQWRTGPLGAKTLCNACGVRFKSGRLFPEYRPACSPTFSVDVHSNSHRKVLEMRRKKDMAVQEEAGSSPLVLSC